MQRFNLAVLLTVALSAFGTSVTAQELGGLVINDAEVTKLCEKSSTVYGGAKRACFAFSTGSVANRIEAKGPMDTRIKKQEAWWKGYTTARGDKFVLLLTTDAYFKTTSQTVEFGPNPRGGGCPMVVIDGTGQDSCPNTGYITLK